MWYLVCWTFSRFLKDCNKWNADCTTYVFLAWNKGGLVCHLVDGGKAHTLLLAAMDRAEATQVNRDGNEGDLESAEMEVTKTTAVAAATASGAKPDKPKMK